MLGFGYNRDKIRASAERYVQQGRLGSAISEFDKILKQDPGDLTIVNTVGDLYAQQKKYPEAIEHFKRVGESYASDGFVPKAIAVYKKIVKLDPESYDCLQKLGELYTQQGLYNDARAQFLIVGESLERVNHISDAVKAYQHIFDLDPENSSILVRMAKLQRRLGNTTDANRMMMEAAVILRRRSEDKEADEVLLNLLSSDPLNPEALMLRAEIIFERNEPGSAIALLEKNPDLRSSAKAKTLMLRCHLAAGVFDKAEPLARSLMVDHEDASGLAALTGKLFVENPQKALALCREFTTPLLEFDPSNFVLRLIAALPAFGNDLQSLKDIAEILQPVKDPLSQRRVQEAIGRAARQKQDMPAAFAAYKQLLVLDPTNEEYRDAMLRLQGLPGAEELEAVESAAAPQAELEVPAVEEVEEDEEFELPEFDLSGASAGEVAAEMHKVAGAELPEMSIVPPAPAPISSAAAPIAVPPASGPTPDDATPAPSSVPTATHVQAHEIDLTETWKAEVEVSDLAEEIRFYIVQSMWDEAGYACDKLAEKAPTNRYLPEFLQQISEGRKHIPAHVVEVEETIEVAPPPVLPPTPQVQQTPPISVPPHPLSASPVPELEAEISAAPVVSAEKEADLDSFVQGLDEALGENFDLEAEAEALELQDGVAEAPAASELQPLPSESSWIPLSVVAPPKPEPTPVPVEPPVHVQHQASAPPVAGTPVAMDKSTMAGAKSAGLLDEVFQQFQHEMGEGESHEDDPYTHYNLACAFREMGLLDEAIGELQKVCSSVEHGQPFTQLLLTYTWLAQCFVMKGVPEASFHWYEKALEIAEDDETRTAVHYEMANAYEAAGRRQEALDHYMHVYTSNIDFRDVGERIRALKAMDTQ